MRSSRRSVSIAAFTAVAVMALVAMPARGAESLVLAPSSGPVGTTVEATADGFLSGPVTFWWDNSVLLGTVPSGRVRRLTFAVPLGAGTGPHTVRACAGSRCPPGTPFVDATFNVVASTVRPTPSPTLNPTPSPATPAPTVTQGPAPTAPPSTPAPETPGPTTPLPGTASASPTPGGGGPLGSATRTPDPTAIGAAPSAQAPVGAVVPSTAPAGDPSAPGTVKVQFPWLPLSILVVLLGVAAGAASRWIRMAQTHAAGPKLMQSFSAGTHHPPKAPDKLPPELPVMATLVESARPTAGDSLLTHEASHTGQSEDGSRSGGAATMNAMLLDGDASGGGAVGANELTTIHGDQNAPPTDEPSPPKVHDINITKPADGTSGDSDVQMKGSKIKEN